jgi:hypothetical protein
LIFWAFCHIAEPGLKPKGATVGGVVHVLKGVVQTNESGAAVVGIGTLHQVYVAVDQSRQYGGAAQVDDLHALRDQDLVGRADVEDVVAFDQDHLVGQVRARLGIEQPSRAHRCALRRRHLHFHAAGVPGRGFRTFVLGENGEGTQS